MNNPTPPFMPNGPVIGKALGSFLGSIAQSIFRRPSPSVSNDPEWDAIAAKAHPPITVDQHRAAVARIQAQQAKVVEFVLPDGELVRSAAGAIDIRDIQHAQGYTYVIVGFDTFGWPMGHPDSPRAQM